jgi:hypothetical protein
VSIMFPVPPQPQLSSGSDANSISETPQRVPIILVALIGLGFLATFVWAGVLAWMALKLVGIL